MDFSKFRNQLCNKFGVSYRDFIGGLRPRYGIVFLDIAGAYLALALTLAIVYWVQRSGGWSVLATIIGSVSVGYWLAYLALFVHEGAHYSIAPDRRTNDLLTNLFAGALTGAIVQRNRIIHWQHHRELGTIRDTERTYFSALNLRFVLEALSGVKAVRVLLFRDRQLPVGDKESAESPTHLIW